MSIKFYEMFDSISINNKYKKWYLNICKHAASRAKTRQQAKRLFDYVEQHHIVPKCFQLCDAKDHQNLVFLTAKEHYICHHLLIKCFTEDSRKYSLMVTAFTALSFWISPDHRRIKISPRQSEFLKVLASKNKTGKPSLLRSRTYDEIYRIEKSMQLRQDRSICMSKNRKHIPTWNKGMKGFQVYNHNIEAIFISPSGQEFKYASLKDGCEAHNLSRSAITEVNKGRRLSVKGWTIKCH